MSTPYLATITREGKWWMVRIPRLNGLTQARRLEEAELMAREYIAVTLDLELDEVSVEAHLADAELDRTLATIRQEREHAAALERDVAQKSATLAKKLAEDGVPVRDIGAALGISFQRAHQLISA